MTASALVAVGDELLDGTVVDTNSAWLGERLADAGAPVCWAVRVADDRDAIAAAIADAAGKAPLVMVTGGLGPHQTTSPARPLGLYRGAAGATRRAGRGAGPLVRRPAGGGRTSAARCVPAGRRAGRCDGVAEPAGLSPWPATCRRRSDRVGASRRAARAVLDDAGACAADPACIVRTADAKPSDRTARGIGRGAAIA